MLEHQLSPKLQERKRLREARDRPWMITKSASPEAGRRVLSIESPSPTPKIKPYLKRRTIARSGRIIPLKPTFERTGPFPFLKLPFDIQVLIGEYLVQFSKPLKCEDSLPYKDGKLVDDPKVIPIEPLDSKGRPTWIPLLQVCPWLTKDLTRTFYRCNTFYVKNVVDWNAFTARATWSNCNRITHLHVDNELIYCSGETVGQDSNWRSHVLLSPLKNLKTLTLYRDDGGPATYTQGGHDEFNSVEWFVHFAEECKNLQYVRFALYPWSGFETYSLANSNMVTWIKDWEHDWEAVVSQRRAKNEKPSQSWYLTKSPVVVKTSATG